MARVGSDHRAGQGGSIMIVRSAASTKVHVFILCCIVVAIAMTGVPGLSPQCAYGQANQCDQAAAKDLGRLGAAIERLNNELVDVKCGSAETRAKFVQSAGNDLLKALVGPYYGWSGTNRACGVKIQVLDDEVRGCATKGASPDGKEGSHYIYRVNLKTGEILPSTTGTCKGEEYGGSDAPCSTGTMINKSACTYQTPKSVLCAKLTGHPSVPPIIKAAAKGDLKEIKALLAKGVKVDAAMKRGVTALMAAAGLGKIGSVKLLLENGANPNAADSSGRTALMASAYGGNAEIAKLLLDKGAKANLKDKSGMTALDYATKRGKDNVKKLLEAAAGK